jgi:hypothetical protein
MARVAQRLGGFLALGTGGQAVEDHVGGFPWGMGIWRFMFH